MTSQLLEARAIEARQFMEQLQRLRQCAGGRLRRLQRQDQQAHSGRSVDVCQSRFGQHSRRRGRAELIGPMRANGGIQLIGFCGRRSIAPQAPTREQVETSMLNDLYDSHESQVPQGVAPNGLRRLQESGAVAGSDAVSMAPGATPLALTMGEPAGIAPDITLTAWQQARNDPSLSFCLHRRSGAAGGAGGAAGAVDATIITIDSPGEAVVASSRPALPVLPLALARHSGARNAAARQRPDGMAFDRASNRSCTGGRGRRRRDKSGSQGDAVRSRVSPIRGTPISWRMWRGKKAILPVPVMMLVADDLRTVPITIHIAVKDVAGALQQRSNHRPGDYRGAGLERFFGVAGPRLAITGLNPHAGEGGMIGDEEAENHQCRRSPNCDAGASRAGPVSSRLDFPRSGAEVL